MFAALWILDRDLGDEGSSRGLLQMAVILSQFTEEYRLATPPFLVQRFLPGGLALLGRGLGYRHAAEIAGEQTRMVERGV